MTEGDDAGADLVVCPVCRGKHHSRETRILDDGQVVRLEVSCGSCEGGLVERAVAAAIWSEREPSA